MVRIEPSLSFADWSAAPKRAFEAVQLQIGNAAKALMFIEVKPR
jgi:hypothetical protein